MTMNNWTKKSGLICSNVDKGYSNLYKILIKDSDFKTNIMIPHTDLTTKKWSSMLVKLQMQLKVK